MLENIIIQLKELSSEKIKVFSEKLIPTELPIMGVRVPDLRKLAKEIAKKDYMTFLEECDESYLELQMLKGYVIGIAAMPFEKRIAYLKKFVPQIKDWAVCDGLVSSLKCTKKNYDAMLEYILTYKESHNEFEVRFLAVMLMNYYLIPNYVSQAVNIILQLDIEKYYAKMGVAWFIATLMIDYPELAFQALEEIEDAKTIQLTIRKVRDSYRIPAELKEKILFYKK